MQIKRKEKEIKTTIDKTTAQKKAPIKLSGQIIHKYFLLYFYCVV